MSDSTADERCDSVGGFNSDAYAVPRRAFSEAEGVSGRGRFIASWESFKRAWDAKRATIGGNDVACDESECYTAIASRTDNLSHDSALRESITCHDLEPESKRPSNHGDSVVKYEDAVDENECQSHSHPRKVVSLLLRRRSRRRRTDFNIPEEESTSPADIRRETLAEGTLHNTPKRHRFRRVQSQLDKSVSGAVGGEGGKYLEYAAELDDDSFERLKDFTKHISASRGMRPPSPKRNLQETRTDVASTGSSSMVLARNANSDEIVGEIRLEDYADDSSEDFEFLEDENVDLARPNISARNSHRQLRMDSSKLTWIGNESEFAAFFADFGLNNFLLDVEASEQESPEFVLGSDILSEWQESVLEHNRTCREWGNVVSNTMDIRLLADQYSKQLSCREHAQRIACETTL